MGCADGPRETVATTERAHARSATARSAFAYRPGVTVPLLVTAAWLLLLWSDDRAAADIEPSVASRYAAVVWTLPAVLCLFALSGIALGRRRRCGEADPEADPAAPPLDEQLIVVVPTIGRFDAMPAIRRVVQSFDTHLGPRFRSFRIDVVVEEGCESAEAIGALAERYPTVRVVVVPAGYRTENGTRFKARANHFAVEQRRSEGEHGPDTWVLHMDDDTGVAADTADAVAAFVARQHRAGLDGLFLAQGLLVYPRELAAGRVPWMADAVRPTCDMSLFVRSTASGSPTAGLHGELILVRADVEDGIGWDYGPRTIVEDADFALRFSDRHPGRSGWLHGRSIGSSPASIRDLLRQRERWVWGLLELIVSSPVRLRSRLLLTFYVTVWSLSPLGHPVTVALIGLATSGLATSGLVTGDLVTDDFVVRPVSPWLIPFWALNVAYATWLYWDGMRINRASSRNGTTTVVDQLLVLAAMPLLSLLECIGVARGLVRFLRRDVCDFHVIPKPR